MQAKSRYGSFEKTGTPGVYRRVHKYCLRIHDGDRKRWLSFDTYAEACAFRGQHVIPNARPRGPRPSVAPSAVRIRQDDRRAWVYMIQVGDLDGPVKIGWSRNPAQRLTDLQAHFPGEHLSLVALVPAAAARELEGDLHCLFEKYWLGGGEMFGAGVVAELERMMWSNWRR